MKKTHYIMAGTVIASDTITLSSVSDGYSVMLTPTSCVIHADFDGSNPQLDYAYTNVSVLCGEEKVKCSIVETTDSADGLTYQTSIIDDYNAKLKITGIDTSILSGYIDLKISVPNVAKPLDARFTFTVERETTMLDWILDWNSNKTQIGDSYLITPKIFVGKKITGDHAKLSDVDGLTGVYIGPNSDDSCGIYGYKAGQDIFHIDEQGGYIGGWVINNNGIATTDGALAINSDGGIVTSSNGIEHYHLYADGHAIFSDGKVVFGNDGSASFEGTIKAKNGTISNWSIDKDMLYTVQIGLNAANKSIAVANVSQIPIASRLFDQAGSFTWLSTHLNWVKQYGGVAMYYTNGSDYGFIAYKGTELSFSAGATNTIAGWNFDGSALWLGTKNNNYAQYAEVGSVTIGTNGLRGSSWYINSSDGTISFVKGWVTFGAEEGKIAGWLLDKDSLWHGTKNDTLHEYTTAAGSMTFGSQGIRGYMWRLDTDGSAGFSGGKAVFDIDGAGHVADGNISWDKDGAVVAAGGSVGWTKDGAGHVADGNISWDSNGNVVFGTDVRAQWEQGIHVAQMIAFGQMLYRDPEFTLTPQTAQFNGLEFYPSEFFSYCIVDANNFLTSLNANGLVVRGSFIYLWKLDILDSSDNVISTYELWKNLSDSTQNVTALTAGKVTFVSGNKLKFWLKDKGGSFQMANIATDESGNKSYTWSNVYGYGDNIYTSKDTPGKWDFVDDSTAPNSTKKVLKITSIRWNKATDHRLLGMAFINQSRANAKFVVKIIAKIPVGWKIENYHNQYGNGGKTTWVTSQSGTGDWFEYQCIVECGVSGTFGTVNHFSLVIDSTAGYADDVYDGGTSILVSDVTNQVGKKFDTIEWRVAFATVWDATSSEKTWTTIDSHGIYTGTLRADQIVSGQIKSSLINADELLSNGNYWGLKKDGSAYFANKNVTFAKDGSGTLAGGNISWDKDGSLKMTGQITATSGSIGNWYIVNGIITSDKTGTSSNFVKLDADNRRILLQASSTNFDDGKYTYTTNGSFGAVISIDGNNGIVEVSAKNAPSYSTATSYISSNGIFSNIAATNALPSSSGFAHYGAIVGLGYSKVNKGDYDFAYNQTLVAGVYGRSYNDGTAPAFGGYFNKLFVSGLFLQRRGIDTKDSYTTQLNETDCVVVGYNTDEKVVLLPNTNLQSQEIIVTEWMTGTILIKSSGGQKVYHGATEVSQFKVVSGEICTCFFVIGYDTKGVKTEAWLCTSYKTGV